MERTGDGKCMQILTVLDWRRLWLRGLGLQLLGVELGLFLMGFRGTERWLRVIEEWDRGLVDMVRGGGRCLKLYL